MTLIVGSSRAQHEALLAALQATGERVGLAGAPADKTTPYAVLWPSEGNLGGPVAQPFADSTLQPQITYIGSDPLEAMWLADKLRPVVLGLSSIGSGRAVLQSQLESSRPIQRDDDLPGAPLFYAIDTFRITTTPA